MAWMLITIAVITLWAVSLYRVFPSPSFVPSSPSFLSDGLSSKNGNKRNVLLLIAHPDDESFFAPTILFLVSLGHALHILCLSAGNAHGKGNIRKEELYWACATLKVTPQQVKISDHPNLQLLTFDKFGVSGHRNHCDVHHGVCKATTRKLTKNRSLGTYSTSKIPGRETRLFLILESVQASFASVLALRLSGRNAFNLAAGKEYIA